MTAAKNVRQSAARLLSYLPESALSRRAARRADALLNLERKGLNVVTLELLTKASDDLDPRRRRAWTRAR